MDATNIGERVIARIAIAIGTVAISPNALGLLFGVFLFFVTPKLLRLFEPAHQQEQRLGIDRELPLLAELLSAHLVAGAGLLDAIESVAKGLKSDLSPLTQEVAARLRAGSSDPFAPWRRIEPLIGLADACTRAMRTGSSIAAASSRVAERLRARQFRHRQASLERAVIRMTLPMGLCLLPAFIATVVIPMAFALFQGIDF